MAKLKGPLFSLGASQQLGKALVYFGWKGLDVVREYVVPANPRSTLQTAQRAKLTLAVTRIHWAQGRATNPMAAIDVTAYALWASVVQAATTWFNQVVRHMVDQQIAGDGYPIFYDATLTPGANQVTFDIYCHLESPDDADIYWGTSKTALINSQALAVAGAHIDGIVAGLTAGTKYYFQLRVPTGDGSQGARSGIYHAVSA